VNWKSTSKNTGFVVDVSDASPFDPGGAIIGGTNKDVSVVAKTSGWKEGRLVLLEDRYEKGKKHVFQETFAFYTPDYFTQTLAEGDSIGTLKPILTIQATRIKP
jgi:hypothetical protein